jgi:hypothetical protein
VARAVIVVQENNAASVAADELGAGCVRHYPDGDIEVVTWAIQRKELAQYWYRSLAAGMTGASSSIFSSLTTMYATRDRPAGQAGAMTIIPPPSPPMDPLVPQITPIRTQLQLSF